MFSISFIAGGHAHQPARAADARQPGAREKRGAEAANLAEVNELIIRRMRTGVLVVDGDGACAWPTKPRCC
jgi:two-component system sensor histidine kinase PilS (NtrC family)